jgi:hypothetical protein
MKYHWLLIAMLWCITCSAQTKPDANEGFRLLTSATAVTLPRGQQDSIKLTVLRSKAFKTGKASITLNDPNAAGLKAELRGLPVRADEFMLYFSATHEAQPGEYNFIPTCRLQNKNKGIVLKLIIQ